ncbi:MAG TPA: dTDP-4-dehydrorhamnose 3,5-epimerase [Longimicrobiales bacterium]|nr:dTDP-4-dehydrorhamnose 3,5-epimerase [Longimicrobiales bacterium]
MPFAFERLAIPDVVVVRPERRGDARGFFAETYRASVFDEVGIRGPFVQDNLARSGARVLRGLHYQLPPDAQGKLVQVVRGAVFDVAVDLRRGSPTFGRWVGWELSADTGELLWVPPGFAHGYAVLGDGADLAYKVTAEYRAELDRGVRWDDPGIGVVWPLADPVLSLRDLALPLLSEIESPF